MNFQLTDDHVFVCVPSHYKTYAEELGGVYSKRQDAHRFPKNYHVLRELAKAFPELTQDLQFIDAGRRLNEARQRVAAMKSREDTVGDPRLRPYQRVDVEYLKHLPNALIGNAPRTGKTPTSIMLLKELGTKKNLVIAPASLIWNWAQEIQTWMPEANIYVTSGTPKKRSGIYNSYVADKGIKVLIVSKDTWKADYAKEWPGEVWNTVFVDEAHFLRNYKTAQSKAIYAIKAKHRFAITGTPAVKHPSDVWGILHFLYPQKFTSYWQFVERYFEIGFDFMGHKEIGPVMEHRREELEELVSFISVQRKRSEVMKWLPKKQAQTIPVHMEGKQAKLYEQMRDDFIAKLEGEDHAVDTSGVLPQLMRLRQLCLDPRLVGFDVEGEKTKVIHEWLEDNEQPVVIMSMFTSYLKLLKPELEKLGLVVGMIHGEMDNKSKNQAAQDFQSGKSDVLLCNIISAGLGFTLDRAETVIFTDKAWNPAENEQAEDRIIPVSQERNHSVNIISFTCSDTVDERIDRIVANKRSLTDVINQGGLTALRRLLS